MKRILFTVLKPGSLLVLGLVSPGCYREFTIEPGLWKLNVLRTEFAEIDNQRIQKPLNDIDAEVEVVLNWVKRDSEEVETIEIYSMIDEARAPITGTIIGKPDPRFPDRIGYELRASGRSKEWEFSLFGSIKSPQRAEGNIFGREIFAGNRSFQGTWKMAKIEE